MNTAVDIKSGVHVMTYCVSLVRAPPVITGIRGVAEA
jgi:hypothetical protein